MSSFDKRKDGFENRFAHDQELAFKAESRCCRLMGLWLGEKMGLNEEESIAYGKTLAKANLEEPGMDDVKRQILKDIEGKDLDVTEHMIETMLQKYLKQAQEEVLNDS